MVTKSIPVEKQDEKNQALPTGWKEVAQALLRNAGLGIYIVHAGNFQYVNPVFQNSTGYSEEDLLGKYSLDLVYSEDRAMVKKKAIENLKNKNGAIPYEYRLVKKNGEIIWVLEEVTSINYGGKRATVGSFMDITARKELEEAIEYSEKRYRTILDEIGDAYFEVDLKGNLTFVNDQMTQHLQYSKEELLGMNYETFTAKEEIQNVYAAYNKIYRTGEPSLSLDHRVIRKDGTRGFSDVSISPLKNAKGKIFGFRGISRDITALKQAEQAIVDEAARRRILMEQSKDGIVILDQDGHVYDCNQKFADMVGYPLESMHELTVFNWEYLYPPERTLEMIHSVDEKGDHFETKHRRKDGSTYDVEISTNAAVFAGQKLIFCICRDITERKRLEEEREALLQEIRRINQRLEEANKELQDFVYIASHDLREPLRKISSFGTLLQDSLEGKLDEDQQENFQFMIDGAQRMQDMIDALLTYSRLTTKAKPPEWVDLNKVIEDLKKVELATILDETQGIIHVPKLLPSVQADPSQMHQLFQNLIGNGLKFHKGEISPKIIIRAHEEENNMIRIEVQDNGIGIDEKYYDQLFTMFKRLHSREQYEGTGIGLANCKKIVERHGGSIGIKSTLGKGSTFWFTLPRQSYLKRIKERK
jgi:PAS domain S-box-containing protein